MKKKEVVTPQSKEYDIAYQFATDVTKKFGEAIKAIALFGSQTKKTYTEKSDIDIIIVIDDCTLNWDMEMIAWYREELAKLVRTNPNAERLHLNTITLSVFWDEVRRGDPLIVNVIRHGQALVDQGGFFDPLKVLLAKGKITPSPEAVFLAAQRAFEHQNMAKLNMLAAFENIYWSTVEAAQATLMALNLVPPSPEEIPKLLEKLEKEKKIKKQYVQDFKDIQDTMKKIKQKEMTQIAGSDVEEHQERAQEFVDTFQRLTKALMEDKKIIRIASQEKDRFN